MDCRQLISDPTTKAAWQVSAANEFGRLAQGIGGWIKGTDTIKLIQANELPADLSTHLSKIRLHRTTTKGRKISDMDDCGWKSNRLSGSHQMETIKILLNRVETTPGAQFCSANITNFYLNTTMDCHKLVRITSSQTRS
jgi:hypothetical protein